VCPVAGGGFEGLSKDRKRKKKDPNCHGTKTFHDSEKLELLVQNRQKRVDGGAGCLLKKKKTPRRVKRLPPKKKKRAKGF